MYRHKNVVIAGGASGIGEALLQEFVTRESRVYSFDINNADPEKKIDGVTYIRVDVRDPESVSNGLAGIDSIDYLINSAGIRNDETPEGIRKMFDVNMNGTHNFLYLSKSKLAANAKVIQVSSDLAKTLPKESLGYATSKLGGYLVAKQFASSHENISVKIALPGPIDTPLFRRGKTEEQVGKINPRSPEYLAKKIIELLESSKEELVCMNDFGVWTHELQ